MSVLSVGVRVLSEQDMELLAQFEEQYEQAERFEAKIERAARMRFLATGDEPASTKKLSKAQRKLARAAKQAQVECNL